MIDAATAEKERYAVGDSIAVSTLGDKHRYELTGIATFGDVDSLGGATLAVFDIGTAQTLLHKQGEFDGISIAAKEGTSSADAHQGGAAARPGEPGAQGRQGAGRGGLGGDQRGAGLHPLLPARDSAASRCSSARSSSSTRSPSRWPSARASSRRCARSAARASRSCARSSSRASSIGLLASIVGLFAGVGIAKGLNALIGADIPEAGTVLGARTIDRLARPRRHDHARGEHHARAAGDSRAADRGRPRGRDAAALALRRALAEGRRRRDGGLGRGDLAPASSRAG